MQARPYQHDMLAAVNTGWESFSKQLVVAPTGSGKTCVFSWLAKQEFEAGGKTLVLVDQRKLARQTVDKMRKAANLDCDIEMASHHASLKSAVVVASIQSIVNRLDKWPRDHFSLVIADEADKSLASTWQRTLKHFDGEAKVCGFTATPFRADAKDLGEYYENIPYQISLVDLIRQKFLAPITIKQIPIKIDLSGVKASGGDYDVTQLNDAITPHLKEVALAIREHACFRRILVFVPLIATSIKFVEILREAGMCAEHIDGMSEDRDDDEAGTTNGIETRFERGEFDILVNSMLMTRGVDIPAIDCVVMLRPTKSVALYQQAIGRGTRLCDGKSDLLLLDFLYDAGKKMVCRPAHLIATSQEEADSITEIQEGDGARPFDPSMVADSLGQLTSFDLLGMQSEAQAKRERALRKKIEEHKDKTAKTISAEEFAMQNGNSNLASYEPTMAWESKPPSEKQIKYLKKAGIDLATVKGTAHASQLLSIHFKNQDVKQASMASRMALKRMGYEHWASATEREARRFFAENNKSKREEALL